MIWLDGIPTSALPLPNRGLDFGDGVFETLLIKQGRPVFSELHMERLQRGIDVLALPGCVTAVLEQLNTAANFIGKAAWPWAVIRLSVLRGSGLRGYAPPESAAPHILIYANRLHRDCSKMSSAAKLITATIRLSAQPLLVGIKHLNRLDQILAAAQVQADGADECVVLDQSGHPTSVSAGNIFLVRGGELLTPKLIDCGIAGTRRRLVMEKWGPSIGLQVRETVLTVQDMEEAEEVFYSNSLQAVRPIARLGSLCWKDHGVCDALFKKYVEELL